MSLVESVTLADGRCIRIVRDVDGLSLDQLRLNRGLCLAALDEFPAGKEGDALNLWLKFLVKAIELRESGAPVSPDVENRFLDTFQRVADLVPNFKMQGPGLRLECVFHGAPAEAQRPLCEFLQAALALAAKKAMRRDAS